MSVFAIAGFRFSQIMARGFFGVPTVVPRGQLWTIVVEIQTHNRRTTSMSAVCGCWWRDEPKDKAKNFDNPKCWEHRIAIKVVARRPMGGNGGMFYITNLTWLATTTLEQLEQKFSKPMAIAGTVIVISFFFSCARWSTITRTL